MTCMRLTQEQECIIAYFMFFSRAGKTERTLITDLLPERAGWPILPAQIFFVSSRKKTIFLATA